MGGGGKGRIIIKKVESKSQSSTVNLSNFQRDQNEMGRGRANELFGYLKRRGAEDERI